MNAPHISEPISHDFSSSGMFPPRRPGRPLSCTQAKVTAICAMIRSTGISDTAAGALAGVSRAALSRAKQDEEVEVELEQARGQYLLPRLSAIAETRLKDGQLDWRAQAWLIKFAMPEVYGSPSRRRRLEKVELPPEEVVERLAAAPLSVAPARSVPPSPSMAEVSAAPRRAVETEGGCESVTFRSEIRAGVPHPVSGSGEAAVTRNAGDASVRSGDFQRADLADGAAPPPAEPREMSQNVAIRSEISRGAEDGVRDECGGRLDSGAKKTTECPDSPVKPRPLPTVAAPRVSRRARRAEQRREAREAWRAARQQKAA